MASNEVEVLDPAPTVEKLKNSAPERVLNRRHFIAALGVAGAAVAGTELVRQGPTALAQQPKPSGYAQVDVLNFLLNIKYLKATLYSYITTGNDLPATTFTNLGTGGVFLPPKQVTFTAAGPSTAQQVTDLFNEMFYDEVNDLVALRALLGSAVLPRQTLNLQGTGTSSATAGQTVSPTQAISLLRMLEDLSASAFAGASIYLTGTNLAYATQALAVNGFHSGALRLLSIQTGSQYTSGQDLTTQSATSQTQNSFTASTIAGSTTLYNFAPTNPITVGSIITGTGIPTDTTVTAVNQPTVYTGSLSGTTTSPNSIVSNVTPTTGLAVGQVLSGSGIPANSVITSISSGTVTLGTPTGVTALAPPVLVTTAAQITTTSASVTLTPGLLAATTKGSTGLIYVTPTAGLTAGQLITGTGLPANVIIAPSGINSASGTITMQTATGTAVSASATSSVAPTGVVTNGTAVITSVSSVSGILTGMPITGTGIPAGTTVASYDPVGLTITMSAKATVTTTGTSSVTPTAYLTKGSNIVTALSSLTGLAPGSTVTGTGIPANTVIGSVGGVNTATLAVANTNPPFSVPANATANSVLTQATNQPTALLASGNNIVNSVAVGASNASGFSNGMLISDDQGLIPPGTTITAVTASNNTITLSAPATGASTVTTLATFTGTVVASYQTISSVTPTSALTANLVGQPIAGTNIPSGTVITAVSASAGTISISQFPTAAAGAQVTATLVVTTASKLTAWTLPKITVVSPVTSETVTIPAFVTITPSLGTATLSQAPTATGVNTLVLQTADPMDVEPYDPGTAALASAGPAAFAGTSPTVYRGIFETAGASTSSANNPAGSVFARTFSQVLAVLYGSTASQTFEGGFFPVGVSGPINFV